MARLLIPLVALLLCACSIGAEPEAEPQVKAGNTSASPSASSAESPRAVDEDPAFVASIRPIGQGLRERMRFSHRAGCPVQLEDLRYLRMSFVGFDAEVHLGEMVVHKDFAQGVVAVFGTLYDAKWPIRRMRLVDAYRGDDDRSMAANNTSAYNCRPVAGTDEWSDHAYGAAIDINPLQNPYVNGDSIDPPAGRQFASIDRSADAEVPPGVIQTGDVVTRAFDDLGWEWGGDWLASKDYQHFSAP